MSPSTLFSSTDLDVAFTIPEDLKRVHRHNLLDLTPWHLMGRELALKRLSGLRQRYARKYVPFARRQDSDDLACFDPAIPNRVILVHDFASEGGEARTEYATFWDWFRAAVEDMIAFD